MNQFSTLNQRQFSAQTHQCPSCYSAAIDIVYQLSGVPVNSVLLLSSQEEALNFSTGDIVLGFCRQCGFIANLAFDPARLEYSSRYESTQNYSPTFTRFAEALARDLIARHKLYGKKIIEIGCGQGEFLKLLCEWGGNDGLGFDPAYDPTHDADHDTVQGAGQVTGARAAALANGRGRVQFVADYYSNQYDLPQADFICCKMTLEHIHNPGEFVHALRQSRELHAETVIFFQVPNVARILKDVAFWDVYYEHCSYFSPGSLARLFRRNGFTVLNLWTDYDDQYVMIEACPHGVDEDADEASGAETMLYLEEPVETLARMAARFEEYTLAEMDGWRSNILKWQQQGQQGALWGGGSKAVSFLTTLGFHARGENNCPIEFAVDVNPHKHGTFLPVTGQPVVAPESLLDNTPDYIIVMNAMYMDEIHLQLTEMGLATRLLPLR